MKFIIERASERLSKPCGEAVEQKITKLDIRNFKTFEDYKKALDIDFTQVGYEHKEVDGHIERKFDSTEWVIEFNTLEELTSFIDKYTDIVIYKPRGDDPYKTIVIYDDYIE